MSTFALDMKQTALVFSLLMISSTLWSQQADVYDEKVTSASNIAATVSNLGILGNSFSGSFNVEGFPSCEYPANSGIEHTFDGGLWIGGLVGGQVAVSTGAVDDASGYSTGKAGFEFSSKTPLRERSSLFDSPFYDPNAISHQDFVSTFSDTATSVFTGSSQIQILDHLVPLGISVDFQSYNWNFAFANFFLIYNFSITNVTDQAIDSVYFGFWMDGVIRNVNITPPGGSAFFNKGGNGFVDSLNMGYEFDSNGDIGYTDSYIAIKFLGAELEGQPSTSPNFKTHFNTWQFRNSADPRYFFPTNDLQKYGKLSGGLNHLADWQTIQDQINTANNRSNLVSAGPFVRLNPGETLDVAFAIICARRVKDGLPASANTDEQRANLLQNAGWAQRAYQGEDNNGNNVLDVGEDLNGDGEITRFILPTPPDRPIFKVIPSDNQIDVYWTNNSEFSIDPISKEMDFEGYKLYKTQIGFDIQNTQTIIQALNPVGDWDIPDNELSFDQGFENVLLPEPITFPNDTNAYFYHYTFTNIANGWQHVVAMTAYDRGDDVNNLPPLESAPLANLSRVFAGKPANPDFNNGDPFVYPNPYYGRADWEGASNFEEDRKLYFANLPGRCEIRVYTLNGDLVDVIQHDETYNGGDARWFNTYSDPNTTVFSGGEHAWDLLSADTQIMARGIYLFVVIDSETGEKKRGKFVIIK